MPHFKLILAYDGTPYRGWQIQPALPTVQGTLSDAIHRTTGERVLPQGSGRTDAGVHALAQVASFSLAAPIPPANLHRALNRCLPPSIRILSVEPAPPHFHARHSALQKTYEYRIFPIADESICPPTLAPYVYPCPWPLSLDALNAAARHVLGTHDFTTFAAADPDLTSRTARSSLDTQEKVVISTGGGALAAAVERPPHLPSPPPLHLPLHLPLGTPSLQAWVSQPTNKEEGALAPGVCPPSEPKTNIRTITHSAFHPQENLLIYTVTANGFLHHMVRNLVGTFVQAGSGRLSPDSIPTLLAARNRAAAGPTAPPTGLFLLSVTYPSNLEPRTSDLA
jgi:tRNA pseudouridine38-40 synthase